MSVFAVGQGRAGSWVSVIFPLENMGVTWEPRKTQLTAKTTKDILVLELNMCARSHMLNISVLIT